MKDILHEIIDWKRIEVAHFKEVISLQTLKEEVELLMTHQAKLRAEGVNIDPATDIPTVRYSMRKALHDDPFGIIAEFKRKSPSKGWINSQADPQQIPLAYAQGGASAISVLTDDRYFGGNDRHLRTARKFVRKPLLYKNFIVDPYQLYQARHTGADAVLLIAAALSPDECVEFTALAHQLELEVLLELHHSFELNHVVCAPDMVGINNRNLGTFHTDVANSFALAQQLPKEIVRVSESGIENAQTLIKLMEAGFNGFLIGETFMKSENPGEALQQFIHQLSVHQTNLSDV